ncbi:MAG: hypothetical protein ACRDGM_15760, partial [bacterium]
MTTQPPDNTPNRGGAPIHPLASTLLLCVDNLWNLADWAGAWILTVPLSFLSVAVPTAWIQRKMHGDGWGRALVKGFLLGVVAAVPSSITGTPVGIALLAWAGMDRASRARTASSPQPTPATGAAPVAPAPLEPISPAPPSA